MAAAAAAISSEFTSGPVQSGWLNRAPNQRTDGSCGGKRSAWPPFNDTPVTTKMGAPRSARMSPT
jgi:hypothetical protein